MEQEKNQSQHNSQVTLAWSSFALSRHVEGTGFTYCDSLDNIIDQVLKNWHLRTPGTGETGLDRKVLVPIDPAGVYIPRTILRADMPICAEVITRQEGEDPYVDVFLDFDEAKKLGIKPMVAEHCNVVCYHKDALLENNGQRSSEMDWEIVALLGSIAKIEHMEPLTMARNFLQKAGGTKSDYTAEEFANAIYAHSQKDLKIRRKTK